MRRKEKWCTSVVSRKDHKGTVENSCTQGNDTNIDGDENRRNKQQQWVISYKNITAYFLLYYCLFSHFFFMYLFCSSCHFLFFQQWYQFPCRFSYYFIFLLQLLCRPYQHKLNLSQNILQLLTYQTYTTSLGKHYQRLTWPSTCLSWDSNFWILLYRWTLYNNCYKL